MIEFVRGVWRKSTANKVFLIAVALVFVGAAVGTTYAIVARPGDLKFLEMPGVDGSSVEIRWGRSDVPVQCFYREDLPGSYLAAYGRVRERLRLRLGGHVVGPCVPWRLTKPRHAPDGTFLLAVRSDGGTAHGAETRHRYDRRDGRIVSADVALDRGISDDLVDRVVFHEVGHVLGLAHDRESSSVMYGSARGRPKDLSSRDSTALSVAYLR